MGNGNEFDVITAKRINIVNEDGTTTMAISNKQRIAAPRMNGKEYPVEMIERQHFAGMIFFNEEGDEMGGLVYTSGKFPEESFHTFVNTLDCCTLFRTTFL